MAWNDGNKEKWGEWKSDNRKIASTGDGSEGGFVKESYLKAISKIFFEGKVIKYSRI